MYIKTGINSQIQSCKLKILVAIDNLVDEIGHWDVWVYRMRGLAGGGMSAVVPHWRDMLADVAPFSLSLC